MDPATPAPAPAKSNVLHTILLLIVLALFVVGFVFGIHAYRAETENKAAALADEAEGADYIDANVKITSVDPIKGEMSTKIEFTPKGSFATEDGAKLKRPLKLYINSNNAKQEYIFEAGKRMLPIESVVDLYEGDAADFPFDKHMGELIIYFEPGKEKEAGSKTAAAFIAGGKGGRDAGQDEEPAAAAPPPPPTAVDGTPTPAPSAAPESSSASQSASMPKEPAARKPARTLAPDEVPVVVSLYGTVSGLKIEASKNKDDSEEYVDIDLHVSRASTALAFSYFIMTIQWALTIGVASIAFLVLTGRRKVEFGLLGYFGGLLFAFPALRNSMPGTPPIGTFGDFISFFWVEIILAVCLFAIMMKYLLTPPSK